MSSNARLAILGAGSIGTRIACGLAAAGRFGPDRITLTRRKAHRLEPWRERGFRVGSDNLEAVRASGVLVIAVEPQQLDGLLREIAPAVEAGRHTIVSVVSGVPIHRIEEALGAGVAVVRAMPNTSIEIRESMTCLASGDPEGEATALVRAIFDEVGRTLLVDEEQMIAATALGACGVAFFLRAIRAASQGGIEIGFDADTALRIAAQTARGAASLLLENEDHPEHEIDRVTTPRGCTISGLNQMEHGGFSSAMIKGIVTSAEKAAGLYEKSED